MKIIDISIPEYGPIRDFTLQPGSLTCVHGANESGKTATVELLTYILFKRSAAHLRYSKPQNIHIGLEDQGKKYALPTKKRKLPLPPGDISPLLYVHASQSLIFTEGTKDRFWDGLKTVLSGMESGITYAKLDEKVFSTVGLQPKKEQWKQDKQEKIDRDRNRKEILNTYITQVSEIEQTQTELQRLKKTKAQIQDKCQAIEAWKKQRKYNEVSRLYEEYREKTSVLQDYERYKNDLFEHWQELDLMKRSQAKDVSKLQDVKQEIEELQKQKMDLQRKKDFADAWDIKPHTVPAPGAKEHTPPIIPLVITGITCLLFALSFFTPLPIIVTGILFACSLGVTGFLLYRHRMNQLKATEYTRIMKKARHIFKDASTISDLMTEIKNVQDEMIRVSTLLAEKQKTKEHLSDKKSNEQIEREITEIRQKTGLAELHDFKEKLEKKKEIETARDQLFGKIFGILGEKNDSRWERLIQNMHVKVPVEKPDTSNEQALRDKLSNTEIKIKEAERKISVFTEIQKTTYGIDDPRSAFNEYHRLEKTLHEYDLEKEAALAARQIFADMSKEQDEYIHGVMAGNESLSEYFHIITDRYESVRIKNKNFVVTDSNGKTYPIDDLSTGAQDQLLLCFRFAALEKAYPHGIFLLLDDAFIFADWHRRRKMMEIVKSFTEKGNQILYFTSDDHTRDLFAEYGAHVKSLS